MKIIEKELMTKIENNNKIKYNKLKEIMLRELNKLEIYNKVFIPGKYYRVIYETKELFFKCVGIPDTLYPELRLEVERCTRYKEPLKRYRGQTTDIIISHIESIEII